LRNATVANGWVAGDSRVICWNEDVMRGQILLGMQTRLQFLQAPQVVMKGLENPSVEEMAEPTGNKWWDMYCPFWAWHRDNGPKKELAMEAASLYSVVFGQHEWEGQWNRMSNTITR
ncbi:MAG: hypothetical protein KAI25_07120, partial [Hyphomicrobiaceae bacterium]|nr:hypothetical protein [Hyphomicrobiaceae bacterium]